MRISDWSSDVCSSDLEGRTHCADERSDRCVTVISTLKPVSAHCEPENGPVVYDGIFLHGRNQDARFAAQIAAKLMLDTVRRSEEHTSELQSLMRISYAVFCLKKKINQQQQQTITRT